jgi:hypothetical protein
MCLFNVKIYDMYLSSRIAIIYLNLECKVVPFRGSNYNAVFGFIGAKTYKSSFEVFLKDL